MSHVQELARVPFFGGFQHFGAADAVKALSPANIYQVGAMMLCAMRLQTSPWPLINPRTPNVDDVDPARPLVGTHTTAGYSQVSPPDNSRQHSPSHSPYQPANLTNHVRRV